MHSNFVVIGSIRLGIKPKSIATEADTLTTWPTAAVKTYLEIIISDFKTKLTHCVFVAKEVRRLIKMEWSSNLLQIFPLQ